MALRIIIADVVHTVTIKEGETFLLPSLLPHCPQRSPNSLGIVVERRRQAHERDALRWYCESCGILIHTVELYCTDLDQQLNAPIEQWGLYTRSQTSNLIYVL